MRTSDKNSPIVKAVRNALLGVVAVSLLAITTVYAADEEDEDEDENKVTVTGSRIKRSEYEGAAPVIVITSEDMAIRGDTTVYDALKNLTQNNGFQFEGAESQAFTPDVQTFNLRGTGVGNTLILINGKRITNYPAAYQASSSVVNFGAIPAAAVDSIEVLATGASAIYGSDAVAGVVNIILKKDIEETTVNLLVGGPTGTSTNRNTTRLQLVTGHTFDKGNVTATVEVQKRDPILAGDYKEFDSDLDFPFGQGVLRRNNLVMDYWALNGWALDTDGLGYVDPGDVCGQLNNGTVYSERPDRGFYCGKDSNAQTNFQNESEKYSLFLSGNYRLNNDIEVYGDLLYYSSESSSNNDSLVISEDIIDPFGSRVNVFGPAYNLDWYLSQRFFTEEELGRNLDETFEDTALSVTVGMRGSWGMHDWEVSLTQSDYELSTSRPWWKAEEVINVFLGTYYGISFFGDNWWAGNGTFGFTADDVYAPIDQALVNSAIGQQVYGNETSATSASFILNGDLMEMEYGDLSYALVFEHDQQDFSFVPDERIQQPPVASYLTGSGWWGLTGYQGEGDRKHTALSGELRVPVLDTLTLNLAARVDKYDNTSSSIGTRTTPSLSFEWRPMKELLVRGGYTESFRAPDMNYVYTSTGFYTSATDYVRCLQAHLVTGGTEADFSTSDCDPSSAFVNRRPGTQLSDTEEALKDETGHSEWIGFSWDATDNLQLTFDFNRVVLEDKVRTESIRGLMNDEYECYINSGMVNADRCTYVSARIQRITDPDTGVSYVDEFNASPINAASEEVDSIDARIYYNTETENGELSFLIDYTHTLGHDFRNSPGDEISDLRDDPYAGGWNFRSIMTNTVSYRTGDLTVNLTQNLRGGTTRYNPSLLPEGEDMRLGRYITYNLTAGYEFSDSLKLRARIVNLLDKGAPKDSTFRFYETPWFNPYVYSGSQIGRQLYLEAEYTF